VAARPQRGIELFLLVFSFLPPNRDHNSMYGGDWGAEKSDIKSKEEVDVPI